MEKAIAAGAANSVDEWEARNHQFHDALYAACDNRWLQNFRAILYNQSVRYLRISMVRQTIPRDVRNEHQLIFDATINRDKAEAERLIRAHIEKSLDVLEVLLPQNDAPDGPAPGPGG